MNPIPAKAITKEARNADRDRARRWLEENYSETRCFPQIDPKIYKEQVLVRITQPKLINQGGTSFCGPAAVLHNIAKYYPLEYARFAWGLFQCGNAMIFGHSFSIGNLSESPIHQNAKQQNSLDACDWVTMATVRMHMSYLGALTTLTATSIQASEASDVAYFLKTIGLTVTNECLSNFSNVGWNTAKTKEAHFQTAINLLGSGVNIFMLVKSFMFRLDKLDESFFKPDHWCTLKSARLTDTEVICRVWQYGQTFNFDKQRSIDLADQRLKHLRKEDADRFLTATKANINVKLPKHQFFSFYFGYLAVSNPNKGQIVELS